MSGPISERAPDITVEADGRAESTTVLGGKKMKLLISYGESLSAKHAAGGPMAGKVALTVLLKSHGLQSRRHVIVTFRDLTIRACARPFFLFLEPLGNVPHWES
jgi:hypothetical protein